MTRARISQVILAVVGLLFAAGIYPVITGIIHPSPTNYGDTMMMSLYTTLGVFLLLAIRNPAAHRSLILFALWSSFAHAATMLGQSAFVAAGDRRDFLVAAALFTAIGALLIAAVPARLKKASVVLV